MYTHVHVCTVVWSGRRSGWRPATWRDARELIKKHGWKGLYTGAPCWAADTIATTVTKMQVNELLRSLDLVKPIIRGSTESMYVPIPPL